MFLNVYIHIAEDVDDHPPTFQPQAFRLACNSHLLLDPTPEFLIQYFEVRPENLHV